MRILKGSYFVLIIAIAICALLKLSSYHSQHRLRHSIFNPVHLLTKTMAKDLVLVTHPLLLAFA